MSAFNLRISQTYPKLGDLKGNAEVIRADIERAVADGIDLIVFPELSLTGYNLRDMVSSVALRDDDPIVESLKASSREIAVAIGYVEESNDFQFYNGALFLDRGEVVHRHRKVYLPTYGMFEENRYFGSGGRIEAFDTRLGRMGMLICEDALHPVNPYLLTLDGAETLIVLSASPCRGVGWDDSSSNIAQWDRILQSYSHLLTVFMVYVNRVGYEDGVAFWGGSRVIGPDGTTMARCPHFKEGTADACLRRDAIRRARIENPYLRDERLDITLSEMQRIWDERTLH